MSVEIRCFTISCILWNVVSRFIQIYPNRKEAAACNQKVHTRVSQTKEKKSQFDYI